MPVHWSTMLRGAVLHRESMGRESGPRGSSLWARVGDTGRSEAASGDGWRRREELGGVGLGGVNEG
jgi:hypothetical protein